MAPSFITLSPHGLVLGGFNTRMYTLFVASVFAHLPTHQECLAPQNQYSQCPCGHVQTDTRTQQPEFNLSDAQVFTEVQQRNTLPSSFSSHQTNDLSMVCWRLMFFTFMWCCLVCPAQNASSLCGSAVACSWARGGCDMPHAQRTCVR